MVVVEFTAHIYYLVSYFQTEKADYARPILKNNLVFDPSLK